MPPITVWFQRRLLIKQTKDRSFSDADILIKSNAEITWEQWLGYTKIANQMFGPIIGLVGGAFGAVLATGTFAAQIGMEIHQAVTGDTEEERKEGFWAASIDIGTTLLFAGFAKFIEVENELSELSELSDATTIRDSLNIADETNKPVTGRMKGVNKDITVVKVGEDSNGRDIWQRYAPLTEKVSGRRYYRADDGSDILEPVPITLRERLYKMRTEGLSGMGALVAIDTYTVDDIVEKLRSELSIEERQVLFNRLFELKRGDLKEFSAALINLEGINLKNMQLPQIEVIHSYLNNIDATNSNFQNANFSNSEFKNAILKSAKLQKSKLISVNFKEAYLKDANLQEADLTESVLTKAKLNRANLKSAILKKADLSKVVLNKANLEEANLENADLFKAHLEEANFHSANLEKANLQDTFMDSATLEHAYLKGAVLAYSDLDNVNFDFAILEDTVFSYSSLKSATFNGAKLNNAEIDDVDLVGASFSDTTLYGTTISFKLPDVWDDDALDTHLNHITNENTGSLLTTIHSIDDEFSDLKIKLANDIINSLRQGNADITSVAEPLIDILSQEVYQANHNISNFMQEVCHRYLSKYNTNILLEPRETVLNAAINFFNRDLSLTVSGEFNAAFIQCIQETIDIPEMKEEAIELYNRYLSQDPIRQLLTRETELKSLFGNHLGQPNWSDVDSDNYILLSPVNNQKSMMLSSRNLAKMRNPLEIINWNNFYLFDNGNSLPIGGLNFKDIFTVQFPLFTSLYYYSLRSLRFRNLLDLLELGERLHQKFLSALSERAIIDVNDKMIDDVNQNQLSEIFNEKLDFNDNQTPFLKEEHYNKILEVYDLTGANEQEKAKNFLSLSAVFTRYSSSLVFGTENNSPLALRYYSSALMKKAHDLSSTVFIGGRDNVDQFVDWNNRLLGRDGAFSCSAILSGMMIDHAKAKFPDVINSLVPPAWS